jgi:putative oxidoreductase
MSNSVASHGVDQFVPANVSNDVITVVGRVLIAAIFLLSGLSKLAAPSYTVGYIASVGLPFPHARVRHDRQIHIDLLL